ncbi:MAG: hypothetical protein M3N53_13775 [Actinomycetota bacterium]|nr:hypothetical protein [Actinomycetota bacterium]
MRLGRGRRKLQLVAGAAALLVVAVTYAQPVAAASGEERARHNDITINGDSNFTATNGVRSGSGTHHDPYVISGWNVRNLTIRDTDAYVVIEDNTVTGRLTLNWNGDRVTLVDNEVADLRVNQNVKRTGAATSGLIAGNTFGVVGQLRHFDGVFENNIVKGRDSIFDGVFSNRAVNFDGFHGSRFRNNTINGYVEVRLHGHHHGSSFDAGSHYHGAGHGDHGKEVDHSKRYHEVFITNNRIYADASPALVYTDTAHSANDRTAASETNPALNGDHIHYTRVHLTGNKLYGGGLMVDVFNADDRNHVGTNTGFIDIRNNRIELDGERRDHLWDRNDGIWLYRVRDARVSLSGNTVIGQPPQERDLLEQRFAKDAGIFLSNIDMADVTIHDNEVTDLLYGVKASVMSESVTWSITKLRTNGVPHRVHYDSSVKNPPRNQP